jgi:hypothetical protein
MLSPDFDPNARGCRLDLSRLQAAGERVARALEAGADLVIINRFGKRERDGKGLAYLIERALDGGTPVVIAVSSGSFADWTKFSRGTGVKLACDREAVNDWWRTISSRHPEPSVHEPQTIGVVQKG